MRSLNYLSILDSNQEGIPISLKHLKSVPGVQNGIYYITEGTNAYISVTVNKTENLGSHTMFIGEITDMEVLSDFASVTYEYYQNNIKPKPEEVGKTEDGQTIWRCRICGYEYVGEELPDDFICPICKHPASDFEKIVKKTEDGY